MRITCLRGVLVLRSIKMKIATFRADYAKNDDFCGVFRALCLLLIAPGLIWAQANPQRKHPRYGALQFYTQYSYLTRAPWFVAAGEPKNAHLSMVYMGFRYVLPSTSGTLLRVPYPN
jgi:hypothetical protein